MRFFSVDGTLAKARRFVSGTANVQDEEVKNPVKLAEILRSFIRRLSDVEANLPPHGVEFEVELGTAGAVTELNHNFNGPVRYSVVYWTRLRVGTYPTTAPILVVDEASTDNVLALRSYVAGRAIVRIEQAFTGINLSIA